MMWLPGRVLPNLLSRKQETKGVKITCHSPAGLLSRKTVCPGEPRRERSPMNEEPEESNDNEDHPDRSSEQEQDRGPDWIPREREVSLCPCKSWKEYASCCMPYHYGKAKPKP